MATPAATHSNLFSWIISWLKKTITDFLVVQLFINLLTWPLFLHWGLPITPLSIVGNFIFSPFLTFFLMLSSLIVTCELIFLPTTLFIYPLEWTTRLWLWLINIPTPDCMITFVTPPLLLSLIAPCAATAIMLSKRLRTKGHKIGALCVCYIICMIIFSLHPQPTHLEIPYGSHIVKIINEHGNLTLIDDGFTRRKSSINQWINYTLLPQLGKHFGQQTVDTVRIKKKSPNTVLFAESLQQRARVKTIIFEDERAKTRPSFHAVPSNLSENPSSQNHQDLQFQEFQHEASE